MRDEILKGMGIGLVCVVIVVSIGSFIGSALSHGPEPHGEPAAEETATDENAAGDNGGTTTLDEQVEGDSPETGDTTGGKESK